MFQHRSSYLVPFTSFCSEDDGKNPPVPPAKTEKPQFDAAQQQHVNDLLAAERKSAEERGAQRVRDETDAAKKKADEDRERDEKAKRGEFDAIRTELEGKVTATESERDDLATKLEKVEERAKKRVETLKAALPKEAVEDFPGDADPLTQEAWLEERQALVAKLVPAGDPKRGNGPNPKPRDGNGPTQEEMAAQMRPNVQI